MTTVRDIAKEARVAPSTVSLVLNGNGRVSAKTRRRVETVAEQLRYRRHTTGRPPNWMKNQNLGVIYAQRVVHDGTVCLLARTWINAMRQAAIRSHHHLSLFAGTAHVDQEVLVQQVLNSREVDGVILIGVTEHSGYLDYVLSTDLPTVVINREPDHGEFSHVSMDNYGAGRIVIDHLVRLGHRRIALILPTNRHSYTLRRRAGAEVALKKHGLEPVLVEQADLPTDQQQIDRVCRHIIESGATAVFTGDDLGIPCLQTWCDAGIKVPEQLSVVGFDDVAAPLDNGMRLSSVGFDKQRMGEEAVRMLLELIGNWPEVRSMSLVVNTHLADHGTIGPAPAGP